MHATIFVPVVISPFSKTPHILTTAWPEIAWKVVKVFSEPNEDVCDENLNEVHVSSDGFAELRNHHLRIDFS